MHKIAVINLAPAMKGLEHGYSEKTTLVYHETVSYNTPGLSDIVQLESTLKNEGYGIHGMTDLEGHKGWSRGQGDAIYWHAGGFNTPSNGIENISEIPILVQQKKITHEQAYEMWLHREKQLNALAILSAAWHNSDKKAHPLVRSDGNSPGVCSHWDVSQHHPESEGHWDCWPHDRGGYFPMGHTIELAQFYAKQGYCF